MNLDTEHLQRWVGRSETRSEVLAPFPANALAATLDRQDPDYTIGTPLPPLWHWLHFLPIHKLSESGTDGHAARGGFLPPIPLPRRMWAGSRFRFVAPLRIGDAATKVSSVVRIEAKDGRSGQLVFLTVQHVVSTASGIAIEEEHDIVYREPASADVPPTGARVATEIAQFERVIKPDPVLLFRYSALTFNSHRIHYDYPYVTGTEGYRGLIVHGPLLATLMLDALRREYPERTLAAFSFRAISPVFDTAAFVVCGASQPDGKRAKLWVKHLDGTLAMEAEAGFS